MNCRLPAFCAVSRLGRELKRQFDSSLYERLALSRDKDGIRRLAQEGQLVAEPQDILKEPLGFLSTPASTSSTSRARRNCNKSSSSGPGKRYLRPLHLQQAPLVSADHHPPANKHGTGAQRTAGIDLAQLAAVGCGDPPDDAAAGR